MKLGWKIVIGVVITIAVGAGYYYGYDRIDRMSHATPRAIAALASDSSVQVTTNDFIVWSISRGGAYMQTPLIYGDYLYNLRGNGSLSCFHATTGKLMYKESLGVSGGGDCLRNCF